MNTELLPCPFCGSALVYHDANAPSAYVAHCCGCGVASPPFADKYAAASFWNRRATQPQAPQGAVTPGFRLLPIEPTMEMYEAAGEELYGHSREKAIEWAKEDKFESYAQTGMEAWRVMVKAAPKTETPEGEKQ